MSTAIVNEQATTPSALRRLVARRPVPAFLVMAYACFWTVQIVAYRLGLSFEVTSPIAAGLGLALPAFLVTAAAHGSAGVRDLLRRSVRWRVGAHWYALALFGLLAGVLLAAGAFYGSAPLRAVGEKWPLLFTMFLPEVLTAVLLIQLFEEAAWTGFVQDTLQARHGALVASLMVAPAFALAHLVTNFLEQAPDQALTTAAARAVVLVGVQAVVAVFFRVVLTWLYNGSGRSVLIAAIFHTAFNSATGSGGMRFTGEIIGRSAASWVGLLVLAAAAVLIVAFTRGRLSYGSEPAPTQAAGAGGPAAQPGLP